MKRFLAVLTAVATGLLILGAAAADVTIPNIPRIPDIPQIPDIPKIPDIPTVPNIQIPDVQIPNITAPDLQAMDPPEIVTYTGGDETNPSGNPEPAEEVFTFRNGATWGMNREQVIALEGTEPARKTQRNFRYVLFFDPIEVSIVKDGIAAYMFREDTDSLIATWYALENATAEKTDYFVRAYTAKYGEEKEANPGDYCAINEKMHGDPASAAAYIEGSFHRWDGPGGTQIWCCVRTDNLLILTYASPEIVQEALQAPETDSVDLTGV